MAILAATNPPTTAPNNNGTNMYSIFDSNNSKLSRPKRVETIAINIPVIPKMFPVLEVSGEDNPRRDKIKKIPETKYNEAIILIDSIYFFFPFLYIASILIVTRKPPKIFIAAKKTAIEPTYNAN